MQLNASIIVSRTSLIGGISEGTLFKYTQWYIYMALRWKGKENEEFKD